MIGALDSFYLLGPTFRILQVQNILATTSFVDNDHAAANGESLLRSNEIRLSFEVNHLRDLLGYSRLPVKKVRGCA